VNPEKLDELIALIYETPVQPEAWQVFMETLVRGFDADGGDFVSEHLLQGTLAVYGTAGFDPYYRELYEENIRRSNVWVRAIHSDRVHDVSQSECGLISTPTLLSTEFFNEWLKPQRLRYSIAGVVAKDPQTVTFVGLMRHAGRPAFASPTKKHSGFSSGTSGALLASVD
jgi:hypothetical protein